MRSKRSRTADGANKVGEVANQPQPGRRANLVQVGKVVCSVAVTSEPWQLDIDAIVVSVGGTLGALGRAVSRQFPGPGWDSIQYREITPVRPRMLDLRDGFSAILASPHDDGVEGEPSLAAVETATTAAIRLAIANRVVGLGLPLLSTGDLGVPDAEVAPVVVRAAIAALGGPTGDLREIIFFGRDMNVEDAIRSAWANAPSPDLGPARFRAIRVDARDGDRRPGNATADFDRRVR